MAYVNNNVYGNAAFAGCFAGMLASNGGNRLRSAVAASYNDLAAAAVAIAEDIDAAIANDAQVTTAADITQLDGTTNTIQANVKYKADLLHDICFAACQSRFTSNAAVAGALGIAPAIVAAWTSAVAALITP